MLKMYDNLDDAKVKLDGTLAYYDGKAVYIHQVIINHDDKLACQLKDGKKAPVLVDLDDPKLNYINYNLGYTNGDYTAVWWHRQPLKQYKQGLKREQLAARVSKQAFYDYAEFGYNNPTINMLENRYPTLQECEQKLKDKERAAIAFHKNFGCTWDPLHRDLIIEYQGTKIGIFNKNFELADDYKYLTEALKEAVA